MNKTVSFDNPAAAERPRLIFMYSDRSGQSRRVDGFLAQVLQRRRNHQTFAMTRISVDERSDIAARLGVDAVPAILVVEAGKISCRLVLPRGAREIEEALSPWLQ